MAKAGRRGDCRQMAWVEDMWGIDLVSAGTVVIEYAYWQGGAELRARRRTDNTLLATERTIPHYWLQAAHLVVQEQAVKFLKKVTEQERHQAAKASLEHEAWRDAFPALAEYMEADVWPDGSTRRTSTLLIFIEQNVVKGCLNDRDGGRALWTSSESLDGLLVALEGMLSVGGGEWRQSGGYPQGGKGQKRR